MKDETCNGYSSYETWVVCLHLGNDETLYKQIRRERKESSAWKDEPFTALDAQSWCKTNFRAGPEELKTRGRAAWYSDPAIDWQEVADFINDTRKG